MAQSGISQVPTEVVETWAQYLESSDLTAFRSACNQANTQTFQIMGQRFFSTRKTSLMGSSLENLEALTIHEDLRKFVKTIYIEDDFGKGSANATPGSSNIWPRDGAGMIISTALGVESLKSMFVAKKLCPDKVEIRDNRTMLEPSDPEVAAAFARDIVEGADLAVVSFDVRKETPPTTIVTINLSAQHQGQSIGFSMLRCAGLTLNFDFTSYWPNKVLYDAPALEELRISFKQPEKVLRHGALVSSGVRMPNLKRLEFSTAKLSTQTVMTILANSRHTLAHVSFNLTELAQGSTWHEILTGIGNEFPELTSFNLKYLAEGPTGGRKVRFQGLSKDRVAEQCRSGLELFERGLPDNKYICWVRYQGSGGSDVLKTVAACVVTT